jgi:hypothetical protein
MKFQPSAPTDYGSSDRRTAYSAQTMFRTYARGQDVGDLGKVDPDIATAAAAAGVQAITGIVGAIAGGRQAQRDREHQALLSQQQLQMLEQQRLIAEQQAITAERQAAGNRPASPLPWIGLGVAALVVAGGGAYFLMRR